MWFFPWESIWWTPVCDLSVITFIGFADPFWHYLVLWMKDTCSNNTLHLCIPRKQVPQFMVQHWRDQLGQRLQIEKSNSCTIDDCVICPGSSGSANDCTDWWIIFLLITGPLGVIGSQGRRRRISSHPLHSCLLEEITILLYFYLLFSFWKYLKFSF